MSHRAPAWRSVDWRATCRTRPQHPRAEAARQRHRRACGRDELVLVISGERDEAALAYTLERIRKAVAEPWHSPGRELRVTCSIGAALFPRDGTDDATLLENADIAMYRAKAAGRNAIAFFGR